MPFSVVLDAASTNNRKLIRPSDTRAISDDVAGTFLLYAVMPIWSVAGFLDWLWHEQTVVVAATGLVSGLPHLEELWRCYSAQKKGIAGRDIDECAKQLYAALTDPFRILLGNL